MHRTEDPNADKKRGLITKNVRRIQKIQDEQTIQKILELPDKQELQTENLETNRQAFANLPGQWKETK